MEDPALLVGIIGAFAAFTNEHKRCGELAGGLEGGYVWMSCSAVGPSRILLLRLQHPPSHEPMHIALARHLLLRLGAGVRLRVGGETR